MSVTPLIPFHPETSPFATLAPQIVEHYRLHAKRDAATQAYLAGYLEGELAFALATQPQSVSATLYRCQQAVLLRLGLDGELTLEQQRLKGWLLGLLGSLHDALAQQEVPR
ncbi:hypothetical protein HZU77_003270 [Neisseriaceae bacterium TC5R-5]|nr:hypothetical protein [Neisseriaceae bacterium TC5R-5]